MSSRSSALSHSFRCCSSGRGLAPRGPLLRRKVRFAALKSPAPVPLALSASVRHWPRAASQHCPICLQRWQLGGPAMARPRVLARAPSGTREPADSARAERAEWGRFSAAVAGFRFISSYFCATHPPVPCCAGWTCRMSATSRRAEVGRPVRRRGAQEGVERAWTGQSWVVPRLPAVGPTFLSSFVPTPDAPWLALQCPARRSLPVEAISARSCRPTGSDSKSA